MPSTPATGWTGNRGGFANQLVPAVGPESVHPWATFRRADEHRRRLVEEAAEYRLSREAPRRRRRGWWYRPDLLIIDLTEPDYDVESNDSVCRSGQTGATSHLRCGGAFADGGVA